MARKKKETTVTAIRGTAPKKGQLPAGLISWLKANGRLGRHVHVIRGGRGHNKGSTGRAAAA